jgi:hypothetical protein
VQCEVAIFAATGGHLIEIRRLSGCRIGFAVVLADLSRHLAVAIPGAGGICAAFPASSIDALAAPEVFDYSIYGASAALAAAVDPNALTRIHLLALMAPESGRGQAAQGARAAAALAAGSPAMSSLLTCEGGSLTAVADRVLELVAAADDDVRCAAMSAVASIAEVMRMSGLVTATLSVPGGSRRMWLDAAVVAAAKCCRDDHPHVRREALRCAQALATASGELAARFVSLGAKPIFALYAEAADDGACPDKPAELFAQLALSAC